ncbi:MAG: methyltransferase domain-containing protein [Patescibacteria group bacterium]|nr:methyltransferase domain-containing protein [Patescibacteria group bacterium]
MAAHSVQVVYDLLAKSYGTNAHRTIEFFQGVQRMAILRACLWQTKRLGKTLEELDVLTVGVGNGEQRRTLCILCLGLFHQRIKDSRLVELDISSEMLRVARQLHPRGTDYLKKYEDGKAPTQIRGDAVSTVLPNGSFDVVIGALIDHIPNQPKLYRNVFETLRPNGMFVVTYPHRRLMKVIRKDIYGIPIDQTRFVVDGREYCVPSLTLLPTEIKALMRDAGFAVSTCKALRLYDGWYPDVFDHHPQHPFSPTVWRAHKLMRVRPSRIPVLSFAVGQKLL